MPKKIVKEKLRKAVLKNDEWLTVPEIVALAAERGISLPTSTLRTALEAGNVVGAVKRSADKSKRAVTTPRGGRWFAPRVGVEGYLAQYQPNRDQKNQQNGE